MATYTIRDLERLSGIKAHTIRIWEKRYNLIEPERTNTNIRTYCDDELKKILNISILNKAGYKISKIADFSQDEIIENVNKLVENPRDTEIQIENLAIAMIDLDEARFEKILTRSIIQLGFEDMVIKVLYPFFIKIGIMWQTGSINPAHEHFISNLVRQKLLVAIDSQVSSEIENAKTFILFLPEGELHELGLLFYCYIIKKRGHKIIYLGQTVPTDDLVEVAQIRPFDYLMTSFVSAFSKSDIKDYIQRMNNHFKTNTIYISGGSASDFDLKLPENIKLLKSPYELITELNYISSLK